ncbi:hypothetical protein MUO69_01280 [Candidatus Bathyarchaeota archaeon]|nr:hypothetical protein [Candidatus Bathyarchaeota archaeon]
MKYARRLVSMIVVALSVALMEKSWVSLAFKSISNVDLACKGRAHKNETAIAGLDMLADRVSCEEN